MKFPKLLLNGRLMQAVFLLAPMVLALVYFTLVAAERYVSTTVISVRDMSGSSTGASGALSGLLGGGGAPTSYTDNFYLQRYVHSSELMNKLDQRLKLRAHFSRSQPDFLYRLAPDASQEAFLDYMTARIDMLHDDTSGMITLKVQGFEPAYAQQLGLALIDESEKFINAYSHRIAQEKMTFADGEVQRAMAALASAKGDLLAFQTRYKLLDPTSQAVASSSLAASLQATLSKQEADLKAALAYMSEDSLQVKGLRAQADATRAQLEVERTRSTAAVGNVQLPAQAIQYQSLLTAAGYAEENYKAALVAREQARLDVTRKLKTVVVVEPPTLPDAPYHPRRLYGLLTVMAVSIMLFAIVQLVIATIQEHQD